MVETLSTVGDVPHTQDLGRTLAHQLAMGHCLLRTRRMLATAARQCHPEAATDELLTRSDALHYAATCRLGNDDIGGRVG